MEPIAAGDLVTITTAGPVLDGIVVELTSATKTVVAMMDRTRGPVLRTVDPKTVAPRAGAGADDRALQLLIRRTPPSGGNGGTRSGQAARAGRAGHTRAAAHRSTGK